MYSPSHARRPRPPAGRRISSGPLRSAGGEASPLPIKTALVTSTIPVPKSSKGKQPEKASDVGASPEPQRLRSRPLSLISESSLSAASPPPPYRCGGAVALPRSEKEGSSPVNMIPPPPPEPLESGPSSVRTSMIEVEGDNIGTDDENEAAHANTLTLRGMRRLIQQHELDQMASELSSRLMGYENLSPDGKLPSVIELRPSVSPLSAASASPRGVYSTRHSPVHLHTVPTDPSLAFSFPQPRDSAARPNMSRNKSSDQRFNMLRAEEDEERIALLEAALAEAKDGEEMQRKAAARLRRDMTKLRRQLEDAEDAVAEGLESNLATEAAERNAKLRERNAVDSFAGPDLPTSWLRGSYGPPPDGEDEKVGWGTTSFPEYPAEPRIMGREAASESTSRPVLDQTTAEAVLRLLDAAPRAMSLDGETDSTDAVTVMAPSEAASNAPTVIVNDRGRARPTISSATFLSPGHARSVSEVSPRRRLTPRMALDSLHPNAAVSQRKPGVPSPHRSEKRSFSKSPSRSVDVSEGHEADENGLVRRHSVGSSESSGSFRSPTPLSGMSGVSRSPLNGLASRMDSVRSFLSDYIAAGRSLGSELGSGSHFTPSPVAQFCDVEEADDEEAYSLPGSYSQTGSPAPVTANVPAARSELAPFASSTFETPINKSAHKEPTSPTSPTAIFVLRGNLAKATTANAYDRMLDSSGSRNIRFADGWSPHSWPTPTPAPRDVPQPPVVPAVVVRPPPQIQAQPLQAGVRFLEPVSLPGTLVHTPGNLAPRADPWDEYSDRASPSPRPRALRPLILCSRPAMHARTSSLALAQQRRASGLGLSAGQHRRAMSGGSAVVKRLPTSIPGRILHDFFCLMLLLLDYLEWAIILCYRLFLDVRAGPDGVLTKRRNHQPRFYL